MSDNFSAKPSALGYLFQVRYALYLLLLTDDDETRLYVEALDDIDLRNVDAQPIELLQLKHNTLKKQATLTDTSTEFWKSIRIWSERIKDSKTFATKTLLTLVTTAKIPDTSILRYLKPQVERQTGHIIKELTAIANTSTNKSLKNAFNAFLELSDDQQKYLINAIRIIDESPDILDVRERIKPKLIAPKRFQDPILEQLEGWWFKLVVEHLTSLDQPISHTLLTDKIWQISHEYDDDNLPTEIWYDIPIPSEEDTEQMNFVRQLRAIALEKPQINKAVQDYFRAFEKRSYWQRVNLLLPNELENYETKLIDEWERLCYWQSYDKSNEQSLMNAGRTIFRQIDEANNLPKIRPKVEERYIIRGSYHILANASKPRVWWHPLFLERLQSIITATSPESKWEQSPIEVANLLNPAFCALLIRNTIKSYQEKYPDGMPYELLFLILPIVLHKTTRELLPRSSRTKLSSWLKEYPQVLVGFPERTQSLIDFTKLAISFGGEKGVFQNKEDELFISTDKPFRKSQELEGKLSLLDIGEIKEIQQKSIFIGRWFADVGSKSSIYRMWGIKP